MPEVPATYPRPLSEREESIVRFMLSIDDPRFEPLREQADHAQVVGKCACGCATIHLAVDRGRSRPAQLCSPAVAAQTTTTGDKHPPYQLLLFLDDACWLASVEIVYYGGDPPRYFPPPDVFEAPQARC